MIISNVIKESRYITMYRDSLENYYLVTTNLVTSVWLPETILTM